MNEQTARNVVLVRAIETADASREIWSDADRVWATRATAEIVGERTADDAFLGRRATLVLERLAERFPRVHALARVPSSRRWLAPLAVAVAFVVGAAGVDIGPAHRINLLAPPVLALLAWNLAVYMALAVAALAPQRLSRRKATTGPIRHTIVAALRHASRPLRKSIASRPLAAALGRFAADWPALAMPLWQRRVARLLHLCAAMLAAGAIAGLYIRGIALEYRAGWQSTFLDAGDVARLLHVVLAPGAWLTGIAIPGADHLRTIAGGSPGENAARWIHLYAATLLLIIIVPRFALAGVAGLRDRRLTRCFPIALESAYFQRLLHARQEGTAHVIALPYSFAIAAANRDGLAKLLTRAFQSAVDIAWYPPVAYGDDALPDLPAPALAGAVRDDVDVVLYLVNASESPADAGYIAPELKILGWIGKPVIVLLNQTGRPRAASEEATELTRWRDALGRHPVIEGVLPLDAFARCWIQESVLLREVAKALPESKRAAFARLAAAWHATREVQFQTAMAAIAAPIARAARERVALRGIADGDSDLLANALQARLAELSLAVLAALYPDAGADALPPSRRSTENATLAG